MYMLCDSEHKLWRLVMLLQRLGQECKTIVYFATCAGVEYYSRIFPHLPQFRKQANMLNWFALHGHMTASKRSVEYARFKNAPVGVLFCTDVAARGLDMPDVDWVLQYDPPQDPDAFVHRCGRTARLGKRGSALIFIRPKEDTYVSFLAVRKSPVEEFDGRLDVNGSIEETDGNQNILRFESFALKDRATQGSLDLMAAIRALAVKDRDVFEKGQVAFVSFVRSYKEHKCSLVFRLKELHLGRVAVSFGLVVLPRMPELRGVNADGFFVPLADIHPNDIPFADKVREKARQARLATRAAERAAHPEKFAKGPKKESEAWSKQKARKDRKEKRQETKRLVRERELLKNGSEYALLAAHQQGLEADAASAAAEGQQPDDDDDEEEEDELEKEARLMRKVKSGKLSSAQFDKRMGYKRTSAFADMVDEGDEDAPVNDDSDDEDDEEDDQDDEQEESAPQRGSKRPNSHDTNQLAAARKKPRSGF
ncbi:hypothetical protein CAOG_009772 [Capsaspora owczarzaki ATCC 30864]|uniref:ATP-dependent RNA helicase n=2 Tax=Capsaspora owczarzaki (strain ATCC 30864) TaxID=595528 RepID=A0A0D2X353_CAPO3|nr:hypothetical protein CAOG_009772 [Capsaspora owczarzaki ATCC 30864]